jgi:uncharacterized protein YciI
MYFLMICHHKPDVAALRDELRPLHRAHVSSGGEGLVRVLTGSAMRDDVEETGTGNFGILEAESVEKARAFAEGDPFNTGGVVERIELIRLADTFQAHRIDPMTK